MRGMGNAGRQGGEAGDLIVHLKELEHKVFQRHEDDVLYSVHISFADAVLGTELEVPTLGGKARLKIAAGTPSGQMLRMREKGIPHLNSTGRGDQLVQVHVFVPSKIGAREKEILKEMKNQQGFQPGSGCSTKSFFGKVFAAFL
jgi:molecular chaperone DnaJ